MAAETFTVRAEAELVHKLDHLADSLDRSSNYLVNQSLKWYLEHHGWQIEKISQDIVAAN
jgi:predicted transcriptional regulator